MSARVSLTVIGSVNLDIVASGETLPAPGETVTGATLARHPGGKGANMALAAKRLGADVLLIARVGEDAFADEALALLREGGVDLAETQAVDDVPTGVALIAVSDDSENQIIVASGANGELHAESLSDEIPGPVLAVLEVPVDTVVAAAERADGFFAVNLAPALPVPDALLASADLIIVNEGEAVVYGDAMDKAGGMVAVTYGGRGAALFQGGKKLAEATPPKVAPLDTTGAGDTFSAALTLALCEGMTYQIALAFACAAGALATTKAGAQPALPIRSDVEALLV